MFLGIDHAFMGGPPILWETMIFGGVFDGWQRRYASKLDALEGHASTMRLVEIFRSVPRKTKKVLRKVALDYGGHLHHGERRRLQRLMLPPFVF